ncbi:Protein of unknown function [Gryllus bimaculatus]|nr:Protein of unknown function [Gryllus bimaculatus]
MSQKRFRQNGRDTVKRKQHRGYSSRSRENREPLIGQKQTWKAYQNGQKCMFAGINERKTGIARTTSLLENCAASDIARNEKIP